MDKVKEIIKLPDYLEPYSIIPIGYIGKEFVPKNKFDINKIHHIK